MESINYSKEQACSELKQLVNDWINAKENRNVSSLARGAGVSENCIRRILNNNSLPVTENLQKIIVFIKSGETNLNLLNSLPQNLSNHFKFQLSYLNFDSLKKYTQMADQEHVFKDFSHKVIFERACIGDGISLDEIKNMFGQKGESSLKDLIEANLVNLIGLKYVSNPSYKNHSFSQHFYKKYTSELISEFYKSDTQFNFIHSFSDGVSTSGYCKIMDILEAAAKEIQKTIEDSPGEIPTITGVYLDTMTYKNYFENDKEN